MIRYKTIHKQGEAEQIIEKSRFIAHVKPVETKEEADLFIKQIRNEHKSATHNVPAMVIGDKFQLQWASDDGEPQGTSGAPMVQMIVKKGITNVVVVISRYFGGIKLGTGGLVRAYTSSAKLGLDVGGICDVKEMCILEIKMEYSYLGKAENLASKGQFKIENIVYEEEITLTVSTEIEESQQVKDIFVALTSGKMKLISEIETLVKT
ncbi:MAG: YigZ family protein [Anaerovoracaceae bacterium]